MAFHCRRCCFHHCGASGCCRPNFVSISCHPLTGLDPLSQTKDVQLGKWSKKNHDFNTHMSIVAAAA